MIIFVRLELYFYEKRFSFTLKSKIINQNAVRPLKLLQKKFVRICLSQNTLIGSTKENVKLLDVLPIEY